MCFDSWGQKELDMTERLNCNELNGDIDIDNRLVDTVREGKDWVN